MKRCNICNEEKLQSLFTKGKRTCMKCRNIQRKQHYKDVEKPKHEQSKEEENKNLRQKFYKLVGLTDEQVKNGIVYSKKLYTYKGGKYVGTAWFMTEEHVNDLLLKYREKNEDVHIFEFPENITSTWTQNFPEYAQYLKKIRFNRM